MTKLDTNLRFRVRGEMMMHENGSGFPDGSLIVVDTSQLRPRDGDYAVYQLEGEPALTFGQLRQVGASWMLAFLNGLEYAPHALTERDMPVGRVVESEHVAQY